MKPDASESGKDALCVFGDGAGDVARNTPGKEIKAF